MIKTKTGFSFFYHWHQRMGLAMAVAVIAWALSGLAHPVISFINPKPVAIPASTQLKAQGLAPLEKLIAEQAIQQIMSLRIFQWQGRPVYRINSDQGLRYFSAQDLTLIEQGEKHYAQFLAQGYLGDQDSAVIAVTPVSEFDEEYLYINRYLPVTRVDFSRADKTRVYINTEQGRLATIVNNEKALTGIFFRSLHSWTWIESIVLRKTLMCIFLTLGFLTAGFGLTLYAKSWRLGIFRKSLQEYHPLTRRLHRHMGAAVAVFVMAFCASGLLHLLVTDKTNFPQKSMALVIDVQGLKLPIDSLRAILQQGDIEDIQLTQIGDKSYWQIKKVSGSLKQAGEHDHHHQQHRTITKEDMVRYMDTQTGEILNDGWQTHAKFLATTLTGYPAEKIKQIRLIESFSGEYGFVNKRLPVHQVMFDLLGEPSVYVETNSGTLASLITNRDRIEGYSFAYLHKWHFMDFLGKTARDILTSLMALAIMSAIFLGLYRFWAATSKRKRQRVKSH